MCIRVKLPFMPNDRTEYAIFDLGDAIAVQPLCDAPCLFISKPALPMAAATTHSGVKYRGKLQRSPAHDYLAQAKGFVATLERAIGPDPSEKE